MSLRTIMGSAYKEDMSLQEVEAFFEGNSKIVNLSNGGYVSKEKFDDVNTKYQNLMNDTKDYEDTKIKYQALVEKQEKDSQLSTIKKYVQPEFAEYVLYQMKQGNLLNDKLEDNVKEYLKKNTQYGLVKEKEPQAKIIKTYIDTENGGGKNPESSSQAFNNLIRGAFGKQAE